MAVSISLFMIFAGLCLIPALICGALSDIRSRTFPSEYFDGWPVKIGGIITIITYMCMIAYGWYIWVGLLIALSLVASLFFYYMGLNFGSGGDWRALIYIALLCPAFIIQTVVFSLVVGGMLAIYAMTQPDDELDPLPFRNIPFAVAILVGFIVAMGSAWVVGI